MRPVVIEKSFVSRCHSQDVGISEHVANLGLQRDSGHAETHAHGYAEQYARHANHPHNRVRRARPRGCGGRTDYMVSDDSRYHAGRNCDWPESDRYGKRDQQGQRQTVDPQQRMTSAAGELQIIGRQLHIGVCSQH